MNILVTGDAGFIGSYISAHFADVGHSVTMQSDIHGRINALIMVMLSFIHFNNISMTEDNF
jgi:nucleoside-diphosphate-sugar epimerase